MPESVKAGSWQGAAGSGQKRAGVVEYWSDGKSEYANLGHSLFL